MEKTTMPSLILDHIKGKELPPAWLEKEGFNPEDTFKVTIESVHRASGRDRASLFEALQHFSGNEDSEAWIKTIKSTRTRSELKAPLL